MGGMFFLAALLPHAQLHWASGSCFTLGSVISNTMKMTQNQHHQSKALITDLSKGTKYTQQEQDSMKKITGADLPYTVIFLC